MPPSEHKYRALSYDREVTPATNVPNEVVRYIGPPESPGQVSMPMPPAPSSPSGFAAPLQPELALQLKSVIVEVASWSASIYVLPFMSIEPYPTSCTAAPFLISNRAQPDAIARGVSVAARISTR